MSPKPKYLPFLFLSLTALALYSFSHSSLHLFSHPQTPNSNLKPLTTRNPNPPNFTLTIKVLAFDRLPSLSRCLRSLAAADYGADTVDLHVFIDHFQISVPRNGSLYLDEKIDGSRRILEFVDGFVWKFGKKLVHYRTGNVGLQAQWLEAWWPGSDDEFAFVVEDDLEVSPLYYGFLKGLILRYYYDKENFSPMVYGRHCSGRGLLLVSMVTNSSLTVGPVFSYTRWLAHGANFSSRNPGKSSVCGTTNTS